MTSRQTPKHHLQSSENDEHIKGIIAIEICEECVTCLLLRRAVAAFGV